MSRKLIILFLVLGGCGKAKPADDQQQGQLNLPEYGGKGKAPFALTDAQSELTYKGNLLFWGDAVTPAQIQRVNQQTGNIETITAPLNGANNRRLPSFDIPGGCCEVFKFNTGAPFVGVTAPVREWAKY